MTSARTKSRDHVVITLSPGYDVVTFRLRDGGAEAVILDPSGTECTRLAIAPPGPDQEMLIQNKEDSVDILYIRKKP